MARCRAHCIPASKHRAPASRRAQAQTHRRLRAPPATPDAAFQTSWVFTRGTKALPSQSASAETCTEHHKPRGTPSGGSNRIWTPPFSLFAHKDVGDRLESRSARLACSFWRRQRDLICWVSSPGQESLYSHVNLNPAGDCHFHSNSWLNASVIWRSAKTRVKERVRNHGFNLSVRHTERKEKHTLPVRDSVEGLWRAARQKTQL